MTKDYLIRGRTHTYHCRKCGDELMYLDTEDGASISGGYCRTHMELNEDEIFMRINDAYVIEEGFPHDQLGPFVVDLYYQSSASSARNE